MSGLRISGLYKLSVAERIDELERLGWLPAKIAKDLQSGRLVLSALAADKMIENVVGVFALPLAIAPNFIVNSREYLVPLVVEEPSIVAALSSAAALARDSGGFSAACEESLLAGQIHITDIANVDAALAALLAERDKLLLTADAVHPRLKARGGGVQDIEFRALTLPDGAAFIAVHILVDTRDAMGANLVNTLCEAIAPDVARICGGSVALRILSNLVDRSLVTASVSYPVEKLATGDMSGEQVRDRIVQANDIALSDPYRAATHNKGIMNGIDSLAIATGNDWRAIEAGAHAFAAMGGQYSALSKWSVNDSGDLSGEICVPLKLGIVGGTALSNPAAMLGLGIVGAESAQQLAEVMAAVGLAQNFSALRALATSGIQQGHMRLHARSVAAAAGATDASIDDVVEKLIASGDVKAWKAKEILLQNNDPIVPLGATAASAAGKIILFGEHAVVYGRHAVALPVPNAVRAIAVEVAATSRLQVREWGLDTAIDREQKDGIDAAIDCILRELGVATKNVSISATSMLPRGMGLGSSAAFAVATTKAVARCFAVKVDNERVNEIAFECEKLAHGTPSGIDNTISCYGRAMLFQNKGALKMEQLDVVGAVPLVVAFSHDMGLTREQVAAVRTRFERYPDQYEAIFDQIDALGTRGAVALQSQNYVELGFLMNVCHGLLNALEVSTPDLEKMVTIARDNGAVGAKLTGAGGGGAIVALCPGEQATVCTALQQAGYETLQLPATMDTLH